jgi:hypothetical protein
MLDFNRMGTVLYVAFLAYDDKDLLLCAWQETALSRPQARWRLRFYDPASTDPFDEVDRKVWYDVTIPATHEAHVVEHLQRWLAQIRERWPDPSAMMEEFIGPASGEAAMAWLMSRSWAHRKLLRPGDPDYERWQPR